MAKGDSTLVRSASEPAAATLLRTFQVVVASHFTTDTGGP